MKIERNLFGAFKTKGNVRTVLIFFECFLIQSKIDAACLLRRFEYCVNANEKSEKHISILGNVLTSNIEDQYSNIYVIVIDNNTSFHMSRRVRSYKFSGRHVVQILLQSKINDSF